MVDIGCGIGDAMSDSKLLIMRVEYHVNGPRYECDSIGVGDLAGHNKVDVKC